MAKHPLNNYPRSTVHLVRKLNRRGYGVYEMEAEERMSNDIKGLAATINDEVTQLRDKARSVGDELKAGMAEAHEALTYVDDMTKALRTSVAELRASLGMVSNHPPAGEDQ